MRDSLTGGTPQDKRQLILESAFQIFTQKGYEQTKMDLVAKRAGVGKGTIYLYFPNKGEFAPGNGEGDDKEISLYHQGDDQGGGKGRWGRCSGQTESGVPGPCLYPGQETLFSQTPSV